MKLLMLTKRFGSGKDAILEDFGRQVRLAETLVKLGNKVDLIAADYVKNQRFKKSLNGINVTVTPFGLFSFPGYIAKLRKKIRNGNYDAIIASSDPIFGIAAYMAGQKTPIIYDAQDNYLTYKSSKLLFIRILEKKVLKKALLVTAVSKPLQDEIKKYNKEIIVIENGIDPKRIRPLSQTKSRKKYGLPEKAIIIAYAGSDDPQKVSIDFIIKSYNLLKQKHKNLCLLLIGNGNKAKVSKDKDNKGIIAFDSVSYSSLMELLSSADVFLLPYKDTPFTRMSMPYKLSEYMAFSKPIVCSGFGDMKSFLKNTPQLIYEPDNTNDFIKKTELALKIKKIDYSKQLQKLRWGNIADKLNKKIYSLLK